jgi:hypothetical protein
LVYRAVRRELLRQAAEIKNVLHASEGFFVT